MVPVAYDPAKHRAEVDAWCDAWAARGTYRRFPDGWLPLVGAIVPGLCAAFLYRTDSAVCFLENVIGNPDADPVRRRRAVEAVAEHLCDLARLQGFRFVIGASHLPSVLETASRIGFNPAKHTVTQIVRVLDAP